MSFLIIEETEYTGQKITEYRNGITRVETDYLKRIFAAKSSKIALITQVKLGLNFISLFKNDISYINIANRS